MNISSNKIWIITLLSFCAVVFCTTFLFVASTAQASHVVGQEHWNRTLSQDFAYYWTMGNPNSCPPTSSCGWFGALRDPDITVTYRADLYDAVSGEKINQNDSVPIGTRVEIRAANDWQNQNTDIYWFGTGYSADSPYGHWEVGATRPPESSFGFACNNDDRVGSYSLAAVTWQVYVPLSISPPSLSYNVTGPYIDKVGRFFTVDGPGDIDASVTFSNTTGRFYYSYYGPGGPSGAVGCWWNNFPLRTADVTASPLGEMGSIPIALNLGSSPYTLNVGARTITYRIVGTDPGSAPEAPLIDGPDTGITSVSYPFGFTGHDDDGDNISYEIDWDMDDLVDETTIEVANDTRATANKSWVTVPLAPGHQFQARTLDSTGQRSGWSPPHTIMLTPPNTPTDLTANPSAVCDSGEVDLTWAASAGAAGYQIEVDGGAPIDVAGLSYTATGLIPPGSLHSFRVRAGNPGSWSPWSAPVNATAPPACLSDFNQPIGTNPTVGSGITLTHDPVAMTYDATINITISTENIGEAPTANDADIAVMLDLNDDGDFDDLGERETRIIPAGLSNVPTPINNNLYSQNIEFTATYIDYPTTLFGPMAVRLEVDTPIDDDDPLGITCDDSSVGSVAESNECDNWREYSINVDAPDPVLDIQASKQVVRGEELFDLTWQVGVPYEDLSCEIVGPGLDQTEIDPSADSDLAKPGIQIDPTAAADYDGSTPPFDGVVTNVGPLNAKSVYTFRCTELTSARVFTDTTAVELLNTPEEI